MEMKRIFYEVRAMRIFFFFLIFRKFIRIFVEFL